jgi:hypothetical protein
MTISRPTTPLIRTTIDVRIDRADRALNSRLFQGWGVDVPSNRVF